MHTHRDIQRKEKLIHKRKIFKTRRRKKQQSMTDCTKKRYNITDPFRIFLSLYYLLLLLYYYYLLLYYYYIHYYLICLFFQIYTATISFLEGGKDDDDDDGNSFPNID
jgi:hypothetical protein